VNLEDKKRKIDDLAKNRQKDGCVKSSPAFRGTGPGAQNLRRPTGQYAATTKGKRNPAPERDRWTFYEVIKIKAYPIGQY
jgi:hypothetical protein